MAAGQAGRKDILKLLFFAWGRGAGTLSYSKIRNIVQASKSHALFHIVCGRGWNEVRAEAVWGAGQNLDRVWIGFGSGVGVPCGISDAPAGRKEGTEG